MATINDLTLSITELPHDQAFGLIRKIRKSRLIKKMNKFTLKMDRAKKKRVKKDPLAGVDKATLLKLLKESMEK